MQRVERTRKDNQRLYKREEQRLKQKYRNILKNLEHDQKLSSIQIWWCEYFPFNLWLIHIIDMLNKVVEVNNTQVEI